MLDSLETARLCAEAAENKKASDILVLDIRGITAIADFFIICSGTNVTQVGAIADEIGRVLANEGLRPSHVEGGEGASWVLMDYGDAVVHIFDEATRVYYSLEKLWGEAPRIVLRPSSRVTAVVQR